MKIKIRQPLPSQVRIWKKSLEHSQAVIARGVFNKCGQGSLAYHQRNVVNKTKSLEDWGYLLNVYLKKGK